MENKGNKNPQMNQNPSAQSSGSQINRSSTGGAGNQSSMSGSGSSQSSMQGSSSGNQSSGQQNKSGQQMGGTFSKENLNNLTSKLQQFGSSTMDKVNNLSTTQKVVGGSLLALGAGWVAMNSMNKGKADMSSKKSASAQNKLNRNLKKNI